MKIRIEIGSKVVFATVAEKATARDFISVLPLSLPMHDLSDKGPRKNRYEVGDIAYWSPDRQLAVYYQQDGELIPSPGIIPIATIDDSARAFNVPGSVKVSIGLANEQSK
jgi:hypothetical protein